MIDLHEFDALTFDCYGTLIDWESGILEALAGDRERYALEMGDEAILAAFAKSESAREDATPNAPYPMILEGVYGDLADEWDVKLDADSATAFGASVGSWPAFADTASAMKYLAKHYTLAVLSNVDEESFSKSAKRIGAEFDEVMTAEKIGSYKPDIRNFEYALGRLAERGIEKGRVLHVAQSLYHDHVPALSLGMKTVWVDRRAGKSGSGATVAPLDLHVEPSLVVEDLAALVSLHKKGASKTK